MFFEKTVNRLSYRYTAGVGGSKFYTDLTKGKIKGTYSAARDEVMIPPGDVR